MALAAAAAAFATSAPAAGAAGSEADRLLVIEAGARASNGYRLDFHAARAQPGGGAATIQVSNGPAGASYTLRHPQRISKRRVVADFGERGRVDLRFQTDFRRKRRSPCGYNTLRFGSFRGEFHFEGENGFTRTRVRRTFGVVITQAQGRCGERRTTLAAQRDRSAILSTCGGESGAGFFAGEEAPGEESEFLGSKIEQTPNLTIVRTLSLTGAAKAFDVGPGLRTAVVRPPEPFSGRARYDSGRLEGNITGALPGAGQVRFTPGDAKLVRSSDFRFPKCFPPFYGNSGGAAKTAVADVVGRAVLSARALRLFGF